MDLRLITLFGCVVCVYHSIPVGAKPTALVQAKNGDLAEKFVEFLNQDQQFAELMFHFENHQDSLSRVRRQTNGMEDLDYPEAGDKPKPPGFFDRAAKFMMELLQRFLKWVNTEQD